MEVIRCDVIRGVGPGHQSAEVTVSTPPADGGQNGVNVAFRGHGPSKVNIYAHM